MIKRKIDAFHPVDMQLNGLNTPGLIAKTSPVMTVEQARSVDREMGKILVRFD
jgi:hypothetical protein